MRSAKAAAMTRGRSWSRKGDHAVRIHRAHRAADRDGDLPCEQGRFDGYEDCIEGPFPESCATVQLENLDAWAAWHETVEPAVKVETALESWYRGECEAAVVLSWGATECSESSVPAATTAYESILDAEVSVETVGHIRRGSHESLMRGAVLECDEQRCRQTALGDRPGVPPHVRPADGRTG